METRYGLVGADLGYSFEHNGKLFFLSSLSELDVITPQRPDGFYRQRQTQIENRTGTIGRERT